MGKGREQEEIGKSLCKSKKAMLKWAVLMVTALLIG